MKRGLFVFAFTALSLTTDGAAQTLDEAISQLRSGGYESAIEALGEISRSESGPDLSPADRRTAYVAYLSALAEVGRYDDALEAISEAPPAFATELANTAGEIYYELGQIERARDQFNRAVQGRAVDRNSARLNLAIIEWTYGDRDVAFAAFDAFIDLYNGSTPLSSTDLAAVGDGGPVPGHSRARALPGRAQSLRRGSGRRPRQPGAENSDRGVVSRQVQWTGSRRGNEGRASEQSESPTRSLGISSCNGIQRHGRIDGPGGQGPRSRTKTWSRRGSSRRDSSSRWRNHERRPKGTGKGARSESLLPGGVERPRCQPLSAW